MTKRCSTSPSRRPYLGTLYYDPSLLAQLPDRSVKVGFAGLDPAPGKFPPRAEIRVVGIVRVEQQHLVHGIEHDDPDRAALDDGQVVGQPDWLPVVEVHGQAAVSTGA